MSAVPCRRSEPLPHAFMDCVREATSETMTTILGAPPPQRSDHIPDRFAGMMAVISFAGTTSWSLVLSLPRDTATGVAQSFAGFHIPPPGLINPRGQIATA